MSSVLILKYTADFKMFSGCFGEENVVLVPYWRAVTEGDASFAFNPHLQDHRYQSCHLLLYSYISVQPGEVVASGSSWNSCEGGVGFAITLRLESSSFIRVAVIHDRLSAGAATIKTLRYFLHPVWVIAALWGISGKVLAAQALLVKNKRLKIAELLRFVLGGKQKIALLWN